MLENKYAKLRKTNTNIDLKKMQFLEQFNIETYRQNNWTDRTILAGV